MPLHMINRNQRNILTQETMILQMHYPQEVILVDQGPCV